MGKIVITENVSLDGVVQDPTGEEGFRHGAGSPRLGAKAGAGGPKLFSDEALGPAAPLLGRGATRSPAGGGPPRARHPRTRRAPPPTTCLLLP